MDAELAEARSQGVTLEGDGAQAVAIVLKKNGRVGQRGLTDPGGSVPWRSLIADVRKRELMGLDVRNI